LQFFFRKPAWSGAAEPNRAWAPLMRQRRRSVSRSRPYGETLMSILAWIILGLVAGFIASKIVNRTGSGIVMDLLLGVVGAFVGGFLFTRFGAAGVTGLNIYSILVATVGAAVVLIIYHMLAGRRSL